MNTKANFDSFCVAAVSSDVNSPFKPELLATHHILQDGQIVHFRGDKEPNQRLVDGVWCDLGKNAGISKWASRINQKPMVRNTVKISPPLIYPRKNVSGAYQGD